MGVGKVHEESAKASGSPVEEVFVCRELQYKILHVKVPKGALHGRVTHVPSVFQLVSVAIEDVLQ